MASRDGSTSPKPIGKQTLAVKLYKEREILRKENVKLANKLRRAENKIKKLEKELETLRASESAVETPKDGSSS